jgi:hypothetical protein
MRCKLSKMCIGFRATSITSLCMPSVVRANPTWEHDFGSPLSRSPLPSQPLMPPTRPCCQWPSPSLRQSKCLRQSMWPCSYLCLKTCVIVTVSNKMALAARSRVDRAETCSTRPSFSRERTIPDPFGCGDSRRVFRKPGEVMFRGYETPPASTNHCTASELPPRTASRPPS